MSCYVKMTARTKRGSLGCFFERSFLTFWEFFRVEIIVTCRLVNLQCSSRSVLRRVSTERILCFQSRLFLSAPVLRKRVIEPSCFYYKHMHEVGGISHHSKKKCNGTMLARTLSDTHRHGSRYNDTIVSLKTL